MDVSGGCFRDYTDYTFKGVYSFRGFQEHFKDVPIGFRGFDSISLAFHGVIRCVLGGFWSLLKASKGVSEAIQIDYDDFKGVSIGLSNPNKTV